MFIPVGLYASTRDGCPDRQTTCEIPGLRNLLSTLTDTATSVYLCARLVVVSARITAMTKPARRTEARTQHKHTARLSTFSLLLTLASSATRKDNQVGQAEYCDVSSSVSDRLPLAASHCSRAIVSCVLLYGAILISVSPDTPGLPF